jgi:DNA-directed RNA polymerase subunit alpha
VGYSSAEDRKTDTLGVIPLDASFSPILRVNHRVEETRVGRVTNYDKLTLEIWTDGSIDPKEALKNAASIMTQYLNQIVNPQKIVKEEEEADEDDIGPVGKLSVEEIGLPTRVANALSKAGYETVEKLVKADPSDLLKVRNLGEKSIMIIREALNEKGVKMNA